MTSGSGAGRTSGSGAGRPGVVTQLSPTLRRVLAPNPGPMTGPGTNTYLVGTDEVVVIDPGPDDAGHLDVVAAAASAGGGRIRSILVTHHHSDHAPGAAGLAARTGASVLGFGGVGGFHPGQPIREGFRTSVDGLHLRALHTPGHASDHLCYLVEEDGLLFSGDHVMDGSTVVIAPPDGDMAAYLDNLRRLASLDGLAVIAPGHGGLIPDPRERLAAYLEHRMAREQAISEALVTLSSAGTGTATVDELVAAVYTDVPPSLHPVARYSVWAHLRKLEAEGRAATADRDHLGAGWWPAPA